MNAMKQVAALTKVAALAMTVADKIGSGVRNQHLSTDAVAPVMKVYARWTLVSASHHEGGVYLVPAIVIASVDVAEEYQRQGLWSHFADVLTEQCRIRGRALMVENVINPGFTNYFDSRDDWENPKNIGDLLTLEQPCFMWGREYAEDVEYEDRMGYVFNKIA